jgi:hypothetical protein
MAMHVFNFEPDGIDPEAFFRTLAPKQILGTVDQVVSFLSMPMRKRDPASVPGEVERMLSEEMRWLEHAVADAPDPKAATAQLGAKLGEGLDVENVPDSGDFVDGARLNVRNALFFCWTALPESRRTPAEAGRIVRFAIARYFAMVEDLRRELVGAE